MWSPAYSEAAKVPKDGQYSSANVHRSVKIALKDDSRIPQSVEDYAITLEPLPGLDTEHTDAI